MIISSITLTLSVTRNARCQKYNPQKNQNLYKKQLSHTTEPIYQCGAKESWADASKQKNLTPSFFHEESTTYFICPLKRRQCLFVFKMCGLKFTHFFPLSVTMHFFFHFFSPLPTLTCETRAHERMCRHSD